MNMNVRHWKPKGIHLENNSDMYADKEEGVKYRFDAIDVDVLGNVYEQYLGFVQGRKSGQKREQGIYYTPSYIVNYGQKYS